MKKGVVMAVAAATAIGAQCATGVAYDATNSVRSVRAPGKAWTIDVLSNIEYRVSFYRPDVFRLEAARIKEELDGTNAVRKIDYSDKHNNPAYAQILVEDYEEDSSEVAMTYDESEVVFKTSELTIRFDRKNGCRMRVETWRGKKIFEEVEPIQIVSTNETRQTLASDAGEKFWGGGQQLGRLMHKGRKIAIDCDFNWSDGGAPNPAPFIISSKGYAVMRHTFASGEYDFTAQDKAVLTHEEERFDAFYFFGDMPTLVDRYTEATGRPNFLPMWALELGDAGARKKTPTAVEEVARKYREDDMPCGWLLVNDGYGCGYETLAPVVRQLGELGIHTGLWTESALDKMSWEVGKAGTRVQKLDVAWTCQGGTQYKNQYPLNCNKIAYDGITTNAEARAFIWTVLGWAGTQRYGICWAGDEYGGWDLIKYMIPGITGSGISGQAYATTDVDGIFGGSNETYLRDLQWKCWTTAMYVMDNWSDICKSAWSYPEPYKSEIRKALKKKIRMTPYIYAYMRGAWDTGAAIVRPMVWNYPENEVCQGEETKYQFMLGDDFIVAPVYTAAKVNKGWWRKGIYLPEGEWFDYNDGRRVAGGQWIKNYPIDLSKIPVFVRAGSIVPMYDEALNTADVATGKVTFDIWPDWTGGMDAFELYEDDGCTMAYQKFDACARRNIAVWYDEGEEDAGELSIELGASRGWYDGMPDKRVFEFEIHTQTKPAQVLIDGIKAMEAWKNAKQGWTYDSDEKFGTLKVRLSAIGQEDTRKIIVRFAGDALALAETPDYPQVDSAEEEEEKGAIKIAAVELLENKSIIDGSDMVATNGMAILQKPDEIFRKIRGHVATHKDNKPNARFTFKIFAGNHVIGTKEIFSRANMKGSDVPQLIEVNIPADSQWVRYEFNADDGSEESKAAKGVWKNIEYIAE